MHPLYKKVGPTVGLRSFISENDFTTIPPKTIES